MKPVGMSRDEHGRHIFPVTQHLFGLIQPEKSPVIEVRSMRAEVFRCMGEEAAEAWGQLAEVATTVAEVERVSRFRRATKIGTEEVRIDVLFAQFLVMPIFVEEPNEGSFEKFGGALGRLMRKGIPKAVLAHPFFMALNGFEGVQGVLGAYMVPELKLEELNAFLRFPGFVREAEVPRTPWP